MGNLVKVYYGCLAAAILISAVAILTLSTEGRMDAKASGQAALQGCRSEDMPTLKNGDVPIPGRRWCVWPELGDRRLDRPARDVSAIACISASRCLVMSDETRFAQVVRLNREKHLIEPIGFLYAADTPVTRGGNDKRTPKELDVEAATALSDKVLSIGSHGRSRNGRHQDQRFGVFVFDISAGRESGWLKARQEGDAARKVDPGVREISQGPDGLLRSFIRQLPKADREILEKSWTACLQDNGFNIEGLASTNDRVLVGLRSPIDGADALVLSADLQPFLEGGINAPRMFRIRLDGHSGIRAMAQLGNGFLILTGRSQAEKARDGECAAFRQTKTVRPALYYWGGPSKPDRIVRVGEFSKRTVKPEALHVFRYSRDDREIEVLVFFDNKENGGPVSYRVSIEKLLLPES